MSVKSARYLIVKEVITVLLMCMLFLVVLMTSIDNKERIKENLALKCKCIETSTPSGSCEGDIGNMATRTNRLTLITWLIEQWVIIITSLAVFFCIKALLSTPAYIRVTKRVVDRILSVFILIVYITILVLDTIYFRQASVILKDGVCPFDVGYYQFPLGTPFVVMTIILLNIVFDRSGANIPKEDSLQGEEDDVVNEKAKGELLYKSVLIHV